MAEPTDAGAGLDVQNGRRRAERATSSPSVHTITPTARVPSTKPIVCTCGARVQHGRRHGPTCTGSQHDRSETSDRFDGDDAATGLPAHPDQADDAEPAAGGDGWAGIVAVALVGGLIALIVVLHLMGAVGPGAH